MKTPRPFRFLLLALTAVVTIAWQTTVFAGATPPSSPPVRRMSHPPAQRMSPVAAAVLTIVCLPFTLAGAAIAIGTAPLWVTALAIHYAMEPKPVAIRQTTARGRTIQVVRRRLPSGVYAYQRRVVAK